MNPNQLQRLFEQVRDGEVSPEAAMGQARSLPFADLDFAKVDLHRAVRTGRPEVIYCPGKTAEQIAQIIQRLIDADQHVLATRATQEIFDHCSSQIEGLIFHPLSGLITNLNLDPDEGEGLIAVVSAGTSDISVAEEAALTARACGARVETIFDVGVAGLHRLLVHVEQLQKARVVIVCAGMEGALPSVVGGLVGSPVIAVPTSVGYGASFEGLAALLGMLNSCASNVTVVNIDNGFGAGYVASLINQSGGE